MRRGWGRRAHAVPMHDAGTGRADRATARRPERERMSRPPVCDVEGEVLDRLSAPSDWSQEGVPAADAGRRPVACLLLLKSASGARCGFYRAVAGTAAVVTRGVRRRSDRREDRRDDRRDRREAGRMPASSPCSSPVAAVMRRRQPRDHPNGMTCAHARGHMLAAARSEQV